jgi:nitrile hydratase
LIEEPVMDGVHDMGGMHGFDPIERDELSYHEAWELRVHGISSAVAAPGGSRFSLESLEPAQYLGSSYYERWPHARIDTLIANGTIRREELEAAVARYREDADAEMPEGDPERYARTRQAMLEARENRPDPGLPSAARFSVGDRVRARTIHPEGHTRLPRYVRGRAGEVIGVYRPQGFQDDEPMSDHEGPQPVYAVRFEGAELWGNAAHVNSSVVLDMWEAYVEPA